MRKKVFGRQLSRAKKAREALFRALIRSLILNGRIETTKAKAKSIIGEVDRLLGLASKKNVANQRRVLAILGNDRQSANVLFEKIAPALKEKDSGFTKITLLPPRKGDMAEMVRLEWVEKIELRKQEKRKKKVAQKEEDKEKVARKK
ncbi:MAG: 50S ribosomal protein L17 [Patescibacteria group bacterium]